MALLYRGEYANPQMVELELEAMDARIRTWPPRMTTTDRDRMETSIPEGTTVYNLTTHKLNFWNGSAWEVVTSS